MTTRERLNGLKDWIDRECCAGKRMKTLGGGIQDICYAQPKVYVGWYPTRPDTTGQKEPEPPNVCPSILIMFSQSKARNMEERRFDRYNKVFRPKELGATLNAQILFSVYEPGIRLPGFAEKGTPDLLMEASEEGLFTLTDWMDELIRKLISVKSIPGTDLFAWEESITFAPYAEANMIADKRPFFYGFVACEFGCYAEEEPNGTLSGLLD